MVVMYAGSTSSNWDKVTGKLPGFDMTQAAHGLARRAAANDERYEEIPLAGHSPVPTWRGVIYVKRLDDDGDIPEGYGTPYLYVVSQIPETLMQVIAQRDESMNGTGFDYPGLRSIVFRLSKDDIDPAVFHEVYSQYTDVMIRKQMAIFVSCIAKVGDYKIRRSCTAQDVQRILDLQFPSRLNINTTRSRL